MPVIAMQASRQGIMVSNIPSDRTGNAKACSEHAVLLTLALLRNWNACQEAVQQRRLGEPCGETLFGKSVLVLGFGNIAKELAPRLIAFGVTISCVRQTQWTDADLVGFLRLLAILCSFTSVAMEGKIECCYYSYFIFCIV
jgi:phosphoglycerate dehydrogenase-like enzyme